MSFETRRLPVPLWLLWSAGIAAVTIGFGYWYWQIDDTNVKLLGLVGGIAAGLFVYLLTFLTVLSPVIQLDRFHRMGIKALLANRHDQAYYRMLISKSRMRIDVMGASCSRFVSDFLDVESDDKVLVDSLGKHQSLTIRLLIPDGVHMNDDSRARNSATLRHLQLLAERFPKRVDLRRFQDEARHSFVITDNDVVAGPIFSDSASRHAPAVHVTADTLFGQKYIAYFDEEWKRADDA